jgi:mono/diheme cytochrome c family protein
LVAIYVSLRFGVPWLSVILGLSETPAPVPRFALGGYMACFVVGTVIYMSADNERWHGFLGPMVRIFSIEDAGLRRSQLLILAFLPLLVGWVAFRQLMPISRTPSVIRVQHPALPDEFASLENPYADVSVEDRDRLEREGVVLYQKNCRACHGTKADGDGPLARGQRLQPIDFTDPGTIGTVIESHPFWRITEGSLGLPAIATPWNSAMPAWGDELTTEEIWKIIMAEYRLSGTEPREPEELGG